MEKQIEKNDVVTVTIEDISTNGEGIGKYNGYTLFVKDTVVGDVARVKVIKAKKNFGYGRLVSLVTPSKDRVSARCPIARQCGGCQIQEMSYESQLRFKEKMVCGNLKRLGGILPGTYEMAPIIGMEEPWHYRNKAQFPVGRGKDGRIVMGFYAGRTHSIIETKECYLGDPVNEKILSQIRAFMEENNISPYDEQSNTGVVRHILIRKGFKTGQLMVCVVINADCLKYSEKLVEKLCSMDGMTSITICINKDKTNVIMGEEVRLLWGKTYIEDYIGDVCYRISPLSFFQVNPVQTEKLYQTALEYADLTGNETVWDLYCGIGTISLFLAKKCKKVYGVEIIPQAIENARDNAKINGIENAEFFVGKAEEILPEFYEREYKNTGVKPTADVIVVDPPRKGCDEILLHTIVEMQPQRVVYVSCDSATLARDLKYLAENGYEVKKVQAVDQFGHTVHVETVVL
ncbi:MAG: 23S rRNA (uracil(1939)-C(5))-methyltransferase RlmD, partial [Thermoflexaceae bacterium]|nr:23S rRNA (uracil(1939)-C(5))-methyltransferase RlmD [Thermoflexaceae bacterium]